MGTQTPPTTRVGWDATLPPGLADPTQAHPAGESDARSGVDAEAGGSRELRTRRLFQAADRSPTPGARKELWNQVVLENQSLARSVAGRYRNRGLELEDLTQVAMVRLVKAVHRYQVDRGWSFAAFALPTISGEIKRSFRDVGWMIRPPRRIQELQADLRTAQEHLGHLLRRAPNGCRAGDGIAGRQSGARRGPKGWRAVHGPFPGRNAGRRRGADHVGRTS